MNIIYIPFKTFKRLNCLFYLIIVLSSLNSCYKAATDEKELLLPHKSEITIIDGRMVFKDESVFRTHLKWIFDNQSKPTEIEKLNLSLGFKSMMSIYKDGMKLLGDIERFKNFANEYPRVFEPVMYEDNSLIYELEAPPIFAYIANKDGIFQVGTKICRVSFYNYYELFDGDETKIPKLFLDPSEINDSAIGIKPTLTQSKGQYYYRNNYFSDHWRMCSRHYESTVAGLYCYRMRTTGQHKVAGIWWQASIYYIQVSWDEGYFYQENNPGFRYNIQSQFYYYYNEPDIDIVMQYTESLIIFSTSYCFTTHRGIRVEGAPEQVRQDDGLEDM